MGILQGSYLDTEAYFLVCKKLYILCLSHVPSPL